MLRTPAYVDRMDVADDADGRVVIFAADAPAEPLGSPAEPPGPRPTWSAADRIGEWLDAPYAGVGIAVVLVMALVLGLLLSRH